MIGIRLRPHDFRYVDLLVRDGAGRLLNLHASFRKGERLLPPRGWSDAEPAFVWEPAGWNANTVRRRPDASRDIPLAEQALPYEGFEFEIPHAHLGPRPWRMRIEVKDFHGTLPAIAWPVQSDPADTDRWIRVLADPG